MRTLLLLFALLPTQLIGQNSAPCASESHHAFDFWIGEWDVFKYGTDTLVGSNTIKPMLGHCILQEHWEGKGGSKGNSFNRFNPATGEWEQHWVDNGGNSFQFAGTMLSSTVLEMKGMLPGRDGVEKMSLLRFTWDAEKDEVRQEWMISPDKGSTWSYLFDGSYRKRKE